MRPEELKLALGFNNLLLLPTDKSNIISRREVDLTTKLSRNITLKYPIIAAPMDTISDVETCIALNKIGAAGILHRFMPIEEQVKKAKKIKQESGKCYVAIGLQDYVRRINAFYFEGNIVDLFVLDVANGSNVLIENFLNWYNLYNEMFRSPLDRSGLRDRVDIIVGNTLSKASVSRAINLGADGVRHGIGNGNVCLTTEVTGIGCPPVTALYYGWKAIRNNQLENEDRNFIKAPPSLLLDGGIRKPGDLVKAIVCGADVVICGNIFAGCEETPGEIITMYKTLDGQSIRYKKFRGMASKEVQEEYNLWDGETKNLFVEGKEILVPYNEKSVVDVVYEFVNGLKSAMTYLGFSTITEAKGSLWEDRCIGVRI